MADRDTRIGQFLEWGKRRGIRPERLAEYERVLPEIMDATAGAKLTESHLLSIFDRHAARKEPTSQLALLEEVGDNFLLFQRQREEKGAQAAAEASFAPEAVLTFEQGGPRDSQRLPAGPRDSQRPPAADGPRESQRIPGQRTPTGPRDSQRVPLPSAAAALAGASPRASVRVAVQFRCPGCHIMVDPTDKGVCPNCGSPPAHLVETKPEKRDSNRGLLVAGLVVVVAIGLLAVLVPVIKRRLVPAYATLRGEQALAPLQLRFAVPPGWKAVGRSLAPETSGTVAWIRAFRGGAPESAEAHIGLFSMPRDTAPASFEDPTSDEDLAFARGELDRAAARLGDTVAFSDCASASSGGRRAVRCGGRCADGQVAVGYGAVVGARLALLVLVARAAEPVAQAEAETIFGSLDPY